MGFMFYRWLSCIGLLVAAFGVKADYYLGAECVPSYDVTMGQQMCEAYVSCKTTATRTYELLSWSGGAQLSCYVRMTGDYNATGTQPFLLVTGQCQTNCYTPPDDCSVAPNISLQATSAPASSTACHNSCLYNVASSGGLGSFLVTGVATGGACTGGETALDTLGDINNDPDATEHCYDVAGDRICTGTQNDPAGQQTCITVNGERICQKPDEANTPCQYYVQDNGRRMLACFGGGDVIINDGQEQTAVATLGEQGAQVKIFEPGGTSGSTSPFAQTTYTGAMNQAQAAQSSVAGATPSSAVNTSPTDLFSAGLSNAVAGSRNWAGDVAAKGAALTGASQSDVDTAKTDFENAWNTVKSNFLNLFGSVSSGSGSLPCAQSQTIHGIEIDFCFSRFNSDLVIFGDVIFYLSMVIAGLIILR